MIPLKDPTTLSMLFHLNSEPWLNNEAYRNAVYIPEFKDLGEPLARISLPAAPESPLVKLIKKRRSTRAFLPKAMPVDCISALAASAYGIQETVEAQDGSPQFSRRSVPSAGGMFPLEFYFFVQRIEGLANGLYHYDVRAHGLELIEQRDLFGDLESVFYTYPFIREANVVMAIAAVFKRIQKKYGPRGYRYTLLEAGHSAQNICLTAAELGLATLCMGGFIDSKLNRMLKLRQSEEGVVYSVAAGYSAEPAAGS
jgi:SagB-type dehydrogenase family enzyme